ncbi:hypothetical protein MMC13_006447 [Lambiella insularis]|nr:hypothetical protein [Lambiella insularis]
MSEPEWRRACVLLGFLANGFLRGQRKAVDHLPANISVPYMAVSDHLGLPPVPTVAAQNLWNYRLLNHERSTGDPENLSAIQTFTGTEDESWFYIMVTAIEARGAPIITIALHAFDAASTDNPENVITCLNKMSALLLSLSELLLRMYERCNPSYFYHHVRPFLAGSKSAEIPDGIFYEDGSGGGSYPQYNGPSAAQSSLWQFIDIAFGVTHWPTGTCCKSSDTANDSFIPSGRDAGFIEVKLNMYN